MAESSPAKSPASTQNYEAFEDVDIVLEKSFTEQKKLELIADLKNYPCLWDTASVVYKNRQRRATAMEELSAKFQVENSSLKKVLHGFRTGLLREIKKEIDGQILKSKWKYYEPLLYMKDDIIRGLKEKEEKEWTSEEVETLLDFYKENEQLWNHNLPTYRDRNLREINMNSLCELLPGRNKEDIKKEWQMLKTIYNREVKREEGSKITGSGTDTVYTSSWKYFKSMAFIRGTDDIDPQQSTMQNSENEKPPKKPRLNKAKFTKDMEEAKLELFKEAVKCLQSPIPPVTPTPCPSSAISQENCNDEIALFLKSIESTLRRFSGRDLTRAKKRINDAVFELEMEIVHGESRTIPLPVHGMQMPLSDVTNFNWPHPSNLHGHNPDNFSQSASNNYTL